MYYLHTSMYLFSLYDVVNYGRKETKKGVEVEHYSSLQVQRRNL